MRRKRRLGIRFDYFWNGILHLDNGSLWLLADPACGHDVVWWQTGDRVELGGSIRRPVLRNLDRSETVPVKARIESDLKLAA